MRRIAARIALFSVVAFALPLLLASAASAQYREFAGKIDRINNQKMIVDNRMGDKVAFDRVDDTQVSGEGKKEWKELKKDDWVNVHWKMVDKPRKAYKIDVLPPRKEEGEDE
jgi:hypothetical protein